MAGLLGDSIDDPRTMAVFAGIQGLLSGRGLNQGIANGLLGYGSFMAQDKQRQAQEEERKQRAQSLDLQMQQQRFQLAEGQRQAALREQQQKFLQNLSSPGFQSGMDAMGAAASGGVRGPTLLASTMRAPVDPQQEQLLQAVKAGVMPYEHYLASQRKDTTPIKLSAGDMLLQPGTFKQLAYNPKDEQTGDLKEYQFAKAQGFPGTFQQYQIQLKQAGRPQVNVNTQFESEYQKALGKDYADMMTTINKAGFTAPSQLAKLDRMEQLLAGVDGGKLAPTGMELASALNGLGIKIDPRLGNKEAAESLSRELAGGLRQPGTGPMTDKDFENFLTQVPSLSKSAEGRKQIMATSRAALRRDIEIAKKAREYQRRYGRLDNGFMDEIATYVAENPVVAAPQGWSVQR